MHFGVNHLGHFLFTNLLVPALLRSPAGASVVNVSSAGHQASPVHLEDVNFDVSLISSLSTSGKPERGLSHTQPEVFTDGPG